MLRLLPLMCVLLGVSACGEPGVCEESVRQQSVRYGFCVEVEHGGECPFFESGDDSDEFQWEFVEGGDCAELGYEFDCGDGIWEDVETECP